MSYVCLSVLPFPAASQTFSLCGEFVCMSVVGRGCLPVCGVCVCVSTCVVVSMSVCVYVCVWRERKGRRLVGMCVCVCVCVYLCVSPFSPPLPPHPSPTPSPCLSLVRRPSWGQTRAGGMRSCREEPCFVRRDGGELGWAAHTSIGGLWSRSSGLGAVLCVCVRERKRKRDRDGA